MVSKWRTPLLVLTALIFLCEDVSSLSCWYNLSSHDSDCLLCTESNGFS